MTTEKEFYTHLHSIRETVWNQLADIAGKISRTEEFGVMRDAVITNGVIRPSYIDEGSVVVEFVALFYRLDLCVIFDWVSSREHKLLRQLDCDFSQWNVYDLCKALTVIVRKDRFAEGYMVNRFEDGTVLRIIQAILNQNDVTKNG